MRKQNSLIIGPLCFLILLGGFIFVRGIKSRTNHKKEQIAVPQPVQQQPIVILPAPAKQQIKVQAAQPRPKLAQIQNVNPRNQKQIILRKQVSKPIAQRKLNHSKSQRQIAGNHNQTRRPASSIAPVYASQIPYGNSGSTSNDTEITAIETSREIQEIDYQARQETDFLTKKVGLNENQIQMLEQKRKDYLTQLQTIADQEKQGARFPTSYKKSITQSHIQWMTNYLGLENYQEYLNMTAQ